MVVDGGQAVSSGVVHGGTPRTPASRSIPVGISKERDDGESRRQRVKRRSGGPQGRAGLYRPGRKRIPILLSPSSRGLLLLQRVRDESHRFAIEFQRSLRSKAATNSILEELPGIGPKKRSALLRQLGSLRAVRAATQAELAAVPGISPRDAETLRRFFDAERSDTEPASPGDVELE